MCNKYRVDKYRVQGKAPALSASLPESRQATTSSKQLICGWDCAKRIALIMLLRHHICMFLV